MTSMCLAVGCNIKAIFYTCKGKPILFLLALYVFSLAFGFFTVSTGLGLFDLRIAVLSVVGFCSFFSSQNDPFSRIYLLLVLFFLTTIVSVFFSVNVENSMEAIIQLTLWLLVFIVISEKIDNIPSLSFIEFVLVVFSFIISSKLLLAWFGSSTNNASDWIGLANIPIFLVPNDMILLAIIAPFICCRIELSSSLIFKLFLSVLLVVNIFVCVLYQSRSAVITFLITVMLYWCFSRGIKAFKYIFLAVILVCSMDALNSFALLSKFSSHILDSRVALWWTAWQMILDQPFVGEGPYTFAYFYKNGMSDIVRPENFRIIDHRIISWPHNLYLELLAERGILGFIAFSAVVYCCYEKNWPRHVHKVQRDVIGRFSCKLY